MARMLPQTRTVTCNACGHVRTVEAGADLRAIRKRAHLSIAAVASRANLCSSTVHQVEHDHHAASPTLRAVYQAILEELDRTAS